MSDDPQDQAEALDEDVVGGDDDLTGDDFGDGFAEFPPESMQLPLEALDELPDDAPLPDVPARSGSIGQLVDTDVNGLDDEARLIGEMLPGDPLDPETAALHIEPDIEPDE